MGLTRRLSSLAIMEFSLACLHEKLADAMPTRECLVSRDRRMTWDEMRDRTRRLANALADSGLGAHDHRRQNLPAHESHQDHLAIYLYNASEYLEAMIGCFKARVVPVNVNYRYVAEELRQVLTKAGTKGIVFQSAFADRIAEVLPSLTPPQILLQVDDGTGAPLLPGAQWYERTLEESSGELPSCAESWSPDDLYLVFTGGTTGLPKGVLWRQHDMFMSMLGGHRMDGTAATSYDELASAAAASPAAAVLALSPFMHAAGQWIALRALHEGVRVIVQSEVTRLDAADVLRTIEREGVGVVSFVGDAFAQPLLAELGRAEYDMSSVRALLSGGAALSGEVARRLFSHFSHAVIVDSFGSSEAGSHLSTLMTADAVDQPAPTPSPGTCVLSADRQRLLAPGTDEIGWLATSGYVPLGYLGEPAATEQTFPTIDGTRFSVPGDRARFGANGQIVPLGRDSLTINSGGEKIFVEEVEAAVAHHPFVVDVVVCGRPSVRWGDEVVAVVQLDAEVPPADSAAVTQQILDTAAVHIARYKLPKSVILVDRVRRLATGKPDYHWAKATVSAQTTS